MYKCGPEKVALQVNKMYENASHVPLHHKKTFQQRCREDRFFADLNSLLSKQVPPAKENLLEIQRRFRLEQRLLDRVNAELAQSPPQAPARSQQGTARAGDEETLLAQSKRCVENIGYVYVCTK